MKWMMKISKFKNRAHLLSSFIDSIQKCNRRVHWSGYTKWEMEKERKKGRESERACERNNKLWNRNYTIKCNGIFSLQTFENRAHWFWPRWNYNFCCISMQNFWEINAMANIDNLVTSKCRSFWNQTKGDDKRCRGDERRQPTQCRCFDSLIMFFLEQRSIDVLFAITKRKISIW